MEVDYNLWPTKMHLSKKCLKLQEETVQSSFIKTILTQLHTIFYIKFTPGSGHSMECYYSSL